MSIQRLKYPSDLSDEDWEHIKPYVPQAKSSKTLGGRPEKYSKREILNAILYLVSSGCRYCDLPHDLPPGGIVWKYFNQWSESGRFKYINQKLQQRVRVQRGKTAQPRVAIIDSQTTKSVCITRNTGYDAGKKTKGRKRHLLTDTQGLLLEVVVHSAGIQDRDGAKLVLKRAKSKLRTVTKIFADGGYTGKLIAWTEQKYNLVLEIVKRNQLHTFVVLPKRWIIERTNAWISSARRLAKEYEVKTRNQESMIYVRMIQLMLGWVS